MFYPYLNQKPGERDGFMFRINNFLEDYFDDISMPDGESPRLLDDMDILIENAVRNSDKILMDQ